MTLQISHAIDQEESEAPLLTSQNNKIQIKYKEKVTCQKAEWVGGRQAPCFKPKQPKLPIRYFNTNANTNNMCGLRPTRYAPRRPLMIQVQHSAKTAQTDHVTLRPWPLTLEVMTHMADTGRHLASVYQAWSSEDMTHDVCDSDVNKDFSPRTRTRIRTWVPRTRIRTRTSLSRTRTRTRIWVQGPGQGQGLEQMWSHQCEHSRHLN